MCRNPEIIGKHMITKKTTAGCTKSELHWFLSKKCTIVSMLQLAFGIFLFSYEHPEDKLKTAISSTWVPESTAVPCLKLNNMVVINMRRAKLCVIGTRVFCYKSETETDPPSNNIMVLDIWNPVSIFGD